MGHEVADVINCSHEVRKFVFVSRCKFSISSLRLSLQFLIILLTPHTILKRVLLCNFFECFTANNQPQVSMSFCGYCYLATLKYVLLCLDICLLQLCVISKLLRNNQIFHLFVLINRTIFKVFQ